MFVITRNYRHGTAVTAYTRSTFGIGLPRLVYYIISAPCEVKSATDWMERGIATLVIVKSKSVSPSIRPMV